jgi:hypothetical protein
MATQAESTLMCRWNIKRNSCPTIENGNSPGKDLDSVRASPFLLKQFHRHSICWLKKKQLLDIKANNWELVVSGESSKRKPWALEELKR